MFKIFPNISGISWRAES